ncbi:hypothetical protein EYD45_08370 [Hyunsoonleella flava]|uniref:Uncharacterized protein n=1 Tax=Hyunsoonleella flava TaxID=2527939 RepID=A0A4Q9FF19_9FLAO|nr:hypothetical protein [Hyunsoonleella flava]TBN04018.1 hypothetical protein EYD45_08370 [Hyunsoonleella flava]
MVLLLCSCSEKKKKQETELKLKIESITEIKPESELDNDYSKSAELFAKEILRENLRFHSFNMTDSENPKHLDIFQYDGLNKIEGYSNKNYPKNSKPKYYEHFTLFVATYKNTEIAKNAFDQIKADSKNFGLLSDFKSLNIVSYNRATALITGIKPGGMITHKGKQVFSLVETCREIPIGGNWLDYEQKLLSYILNTENEIEIEVLNSDCGKMTNYIVEKRKASR